MRAEAVRTCVTENMPHQMKQSRRARRQDSTKKRANKKPSMATPMTSSCSLELVVVTVVEVGDEEEEIAGVEAEDRELVEVGSSAGGEDEEADEEMDDEEGGRWVMVWEGRWVMGWEGRWVMGWEGRWVRLW